MKIYFITGNARKVGEAKLGVEGAHDITLPATADALAAMQAAFPQLEFVLTTAGDVQTQVNNVEDLIAQQIDGGPGLASTWPRDLEPLSRSEVKALQEALNAKGFVTGTPDGVAGPATRVGLREYQKSVGLPADGYPTKDMLAKLLEKQAK